MQCRRTGSGELCIEQFVALMLLSVVFRNSVPMNIRVSVYQSIFVRKIFAAGFCKPPGNSLTPGVACICKQRTAIKLRVYVIYLPAYCADVTNMSLHDNPPPFEKLYCQRRRMGSSSASQKDYRLVKVQTCFSNRHVASICHLGGLKPIGLWIMAPRVGWGTSS